MKHLIDLIEKFEEKKGNDISDDQYDTINIIRTLSEITTDEEYEELFEELFCEVSYLD